MSEKCIFCTKKAIFESKTGSKICEIHYEAIDTYSKPSFKKIHGEYFVNLNCDCGDLETVLTEYQIGHDFTNNKRDIECLFCDKEVILRFL